MYIDFYFQTGRWRPFNLHQCHNCFIFSPKTHMAQSPTTSNHIYSESANQSKSNNHMISQWNHCSISPCIHEYIVYGTNIVFEINTYYHLYRAKRSDNTCYCIYSSQYYIYVHVFGWIYGIDKIYITFNPVWNRLDSRSLVFSQWCDLVTSGSHRIKHMGVIYLGLYAQARKTRFTRHSSLVPAQSRLSFSQLFFFFLQYYTDLNPCSWCCADNCSRIID